MVKNRTVWGAFTLAMVTSALLGPMIGRLIDRGFGRVVFSGSAAVGAVLLACLSQVEYLWQFYCVWLGIGVAMAGTLYDACFSVLTHTLGDQTRRAITIVTLVAGFAGTLAFPSMHLLVGWVGWRNAILVFASVELFVAVPSNLECMSACRPTTGLVNTLRRAPRAGAASGRVKIAALLAPCRGVCCGQF